MARLRGRSDPLHIQTDTTTTTNGQPQDAPPIAAAFLVQFDMRKGYTVAWKNSVPEAQVDGVVEYKSLPSGLHHVKEDLIYFIHGDYAGISAFINEPAPSTERNAIMIAVGVLVPLDYGRMGKSWLHAAGLKELARLQVADIENTEALEEYWDRYRITNFETQTESPLSIEAGASKGHERRSRGISDAAAFLATPQTLSQYHPALSLPNFIRSFGPLIFPLYRAALLRKRILLLGEAPVQSTCEFVYNLSIISSVPKSLLSLLPVDGVPDLRLRPLFSIGVHDMSDLLDLNNSTTSPGDFSQSWIACTTDDVLATKPELFDMLVMLPPHSAEQAPSKIYPKLVDSSPLLSRNFPKVGLKATQRDARRYRNLRAGLKSLPTNGTGPIVERPEEEDGDSIVSEASSTLSRNSIVEPMPWSLIAYTSLVWWASAGERREGLNEQEEAENEQDGTLLAANLDYMQNGFPSQYVRDIPQEIALVSYFHRLTSLIITTISDAISRQDGEAVRRVSDSYHDEEDNESDIENENREEANGSPPKPAPAGVAVANEHAIEDEADHDDDQRPLLEDESRQQQHQQPDADDDEPVEITSDDMSIMGLDIWSAADRTFVHDLIRLWWGRDAEVRGGHVECCGIRLL